MLLRSAACDSGAGSLREAVEAANATPGADTIDFGPLAKGTIHLASQLNVTEDVSISGTGEDKIVISGYDATRILHASGAGTHVSISQVTLADGLAAVPGGTALVVPS